MIHGECVSLTAKQTIGLPLDLLTRVPDGFLGAAFSSFFHEDWTRRYTRQTIYRVCSTLWSQEPLDVQGTHRPNMIRRPEIGLRKVQGEYTCCHGKSTMVSSSRRYGIFATFLYGYNSLYIHYNSGNKLELLSPSTKYPPLQQSKGWQIRMEHPWLQMNLTRSLFLCRNSKPDIWQRWLLRLSGTNEGYLHEGVGYSHLY